MVDFHNKCKNPIGFSGTDGHIFVAENYNNENLHKFAKMQSVTSMTNLFYNGTFR